MEYWLVVSNPSGLGFPGRGEHAVASAAVLVSPRTGRRLGEVTCACGSASRALGGEVYRDLLERAWDDAPCSAVVTAGRGAPSRP